MSDTAPTEPPAGAAPKDSGRNSRLVVRKTMEEEYRNKYYEISREKCYDLIKDFAECAKESSMAVVFKCQPQSKKMNTCLDTHSSEEGFIKFMGTRGYDYVTVKSPGFLFGETERQCFIRRSNNK